MEEPASTGSSSFYSKAPRTNQGVPHEDCTDTGTVTSSFDWPSATVIVVVPDMPGVTEKEAPPVCVTEAIYVSALVAVKLPL